MRLFSGFFRKPSALPVATHSTESAKAVLTASTQAGYGYFNHIAGTDYFPPRSFLNEFLLIGHETWDQDRMHPEWTPFVLSPDDYADVKAWWVASHPNAVESDLGAEGWDHWLGLILHPGDWGFPNGLPSPSDATQLNQRHHRA
jgi:hypothetical protein